MLLRHQPVAEPRQVDHFIITQLAATNNGDPMFFVEVVAWLDRLIAFAQGAGKLRVALEADAQWLRPFGNERKHLLLLARHILVPYLVHRDIVPKGIVEPRPGQTEQKFFELLVCHSTMILQPLMPHKIPHHRQWYEDDQANHQPKGDVATKWQLHEVHPA